MVEGYRRQHEIEKAWLGTLIETQLQRLNATLRRLLEHRPGVPHAEPTEKTAEKIS